MDTRLLDNKIQSFMHFLNIYSDQEIADEISRFFSTKKSQGHKEVIYDRGQLMLMSAGKQISTINVAVENDRVVKFDGASIEEVNPYAYIEGFEIQMKGGDSRKRRRSRSSGGTSSNNNNNNNNNG